MTYYAVNLIVYIISIFLAMIALNCFHFDRFLRKGKQKEFYLFYIMPSCVFGYLFAQFILSFGTFSSHL